jgi:hypothetical protein
MLWAWRYSTARRTFFISSRAAPSVYLPTSSLTLSLTTSVEREYEVIQSLSSLWVVHPLRSRTDSDGVHAGSSRDLAQVLGITMEFFLSSWYHCARLTGPGR